MSEAKNERTGLEPIATNSAAKLLEEKDRRIATLEASLHIQLGYKEAFLAAHTALVNELNLEISRLSHCLEDMRSALSVSTLSRSTVVEHLAIPRYLLN
ncbi:hypothetical protein FTO74_17860 [Granulicella sp. WH15]|uniref:hypothetical protein n=1 Tax=Granulicella sp. WH15 TaxID=2602070 RepID=UPI00136766D5|nr:hypothetical protein [Granulicella sp. WH15]QHN05012.1 hypothetical protein FTO74_17860 [Granulicella sp. WH15]